MIELLDEQKPQQQDKPASAPPQVIAPHQHAPNQHAPNQHAPAAEPPLVLLTKAEVLAKIKVTGPTLWMWVRQGKFPSSRLLSPNKTVWIEAEVDTWMRARPIREYKPISR
jgi:predicted DNA-binding transcriptional regulator AlpA